MARDWFIAYLSITITAACLGGDICLSSSHPSSNVTWCVTVNQPNKSPCDEHTCKRCEQLSTYAKEKLVPNFTELLFLPGKHNLGVDFTLSHLHDITLRSDSRKAVKIACEGRTGFRFENIMNLCIFGLSFFECSMDNSYNHDHMDGENMTLFSGLFFNRVENLTILNVTVHNSTGYGIYLKNTLGDSVIKFSTFQHSHDAEHCRGGNAVVNCSISESNKSRSVFIEDSKFLNGTSTAMENIFSSPGLILHLNCPEMKVKINKVSMENNSGCKSNCSQCSFDADTNGNDFGGNMAIIYKTDAAVEISACNFSRGEAFFGGGIFVQYSGELACKTNLKVKNSRFYQNKAYVNGGALYFEMNHTSDGQRQACNRNYQLKLIGTQFIENVVQTSKDAGIGLTLTYFYNKQFFAGHFAKYSTLIEKCCFKNSSAEREQGINSSGSAALYTSQQPGELVIKDSQFINNQVAGIAAFRSLLKFMGEVNITRNKGYDGGGIILCEASYMILSSNTTLNISFNSAKSSGGGIYAEGRCVQVQPLCFYQIDQEEGQSIDDFKNTTSVILWKNTAEFAGTHIYGGTVDKCHIPHIDHDIFSDLFHWDRSDPSAISSDPLNVCFCTDSKRNCSKTDLTLDESQSVYSGEPFSVSLVIVGQYSGTVPGYVEVDLIDKGNGTSSSANATRQLPKKCSSHQITIHTSATRATVLLKVRNEHANYQLNLNPIKVHVTMKEEPIGFHCTGDENPPYVCQMSPTLNISEKGFRCIINENKTAVVQRPSPYWLGYDRHRRGFVLYAYCPLDYCRHYNTSIRTNHTLFDADSQCEHNHSGTLCGKCRRNYSFAIGSLRCLDCQQVTLLKTVGLSVMMALVGLAGILVLLLLDITVTQGTMSGFLFYCNLFYIFRGSLFPSVDTNHPAFSSLHDTYTGFVSFMNLIFAYNCCYYNGLDMCGHCWLQFLLVFYLWAVTALFVWLCRRFPWLARRVTSNTVPVLATVVLMSYTSINITSIYSLMFARLNYPVPAPNGTNNVSMKYSGPAPNGMHNVTKIVMLYDGNMEYFGPKHVPLFVVGCFLATLSFLFTLVLLFVQPLQRFSHLWPFRWVNKVKPLLDAYTCPHIIKPSCRFWNGYLLLARVLLYLFFMTQTRGDHHRIIPLSVAVVCLVVLATAWAVGGVYTKPLLNLLSSSYILNMAVLSIVALYYHPETQDSKENDGILMQVAFGSLTIVLATFSLTILYHVYARIRQLGWCYRVVRSRIVAGRKGSSNSQAMTGYVQSTADGEESDLECLVDPLLAPGAHSQSASGRVFPAPTCINHTQYREPQLMDLDSVN